VVPFAMVRKPRASEAIDEFETAAIKALVAQSLMAADVRRQLPFTRRASRRVEEASLMIELVVAEGMPRIVPGDVQMSVARCARILCVPLQVNLGGRTPRRIGEGEC
jgi:hypothetical protein